MGPIEAREIDGPRVGAYRDSAGRRERPPRRAWQAVEPVTLFTFLRRRVDARGRRRKGAASNNQGVMERHASCGHGPANMTEEGRFRRLFGAAAHLCQVEADLVAAGYPDLIEKLDDIRAAIDLEIAYLEPDLTDSP